MNRQIYELDSKTIANSDAIPLQDSVGASEAKKVTVQNIIDVVPSDPTKSDKALSILSKSANYSVVDADNGKVIECNGTFNITFDAGLSTGFQVMITNIGTGIITLTEGSAIINSKDNNLNISDQYAGVTVYHRGGDVVLAMGDLTA